MTTPRTTARREMFFDAEVLFNGGDTTQTNQRKPRTNRNRLTPENSRIDWRM